jgi:hypothetical protein
MQYLLLIYSAQSQRPSGKEQQLESFHAYTAFGKSIADSGHMRGAEALQLVETAKTVRVRDGQTMLTDGPFAETKEQLGGYYVIEATNLDEACAIAARIPSATFGSVEVRPILKYS